MNILDQLKRPFPVNRVHWRVGATNKDKTSAIALAYIDARDVMKRLDDVVGFDKWQCRYPFAADGLLICEIGIWLNDQWVWKSNGAGDTQVEAEKGKCSDAFKRAAVLWGIGQYLYMLPNKWVPLVNGKLDSIPPMPKWAIPEIYDEIIAKNRSIEDGE